MRGKQHIGIILIIVLLCGIFSCAWRQNDRCWISKERYETARELYLQTNSLDLVQQALKDSAWMPGEINEAAYRLVKEYNLESVQPVE